MTAKIFLQFKPWKKSVFSVVPLSSKELMKARKGFPINNSVLLLVPEFI